MKSNPGQPLRTELAERLLASPGQCIRPMDFLRHDIAQLHEENLFRDFRTVATAQNARVACDGKEVICLCSNNYLGLASHPALCEAAAKAAREFGVGAGASRLVSGHMTLHAELEDRLAQFEGTEAALVFPSGYMANIGAVASLVGQEDLVLSDRLNHASIFDACRLSGATLRVYHHRDMDCLARALKRGGSFRRRLIVTDAVFSMDGDVAPLPEIADLADRYGAMVMVDEAHATGVLGENGRGAAEAFGVENRIPIRVGTLSKALGCQGGFVTGSRELVDWLRNRCRSFIYTTAIAPPLCAAAIQAIDIVEREPQRRGDLQERIRRVHELLGVHTACPTPGGLFTPIVPVVVGEASDALAVSSYLWERGVFVPAIRPPTVPKGTSRLRLSVMATHSEADLGIACGAVCEALSRLGRRPGASLP